MIRRIRPVPPPGEAELGCVIPLYRDGDDFGMRGAGRRVNPIDEESVAALRPLQQALATRLAALAPGRAVPDDIAVLYASGLAADEVEAHLRRSYRDAPDLVARATAAVLDTVRRWRARPLGPAYPLLFLDGLDLTLCSGDQAWALPVLVVRGVAADGAGSVLDLWAGRPSGPRVLAALARRGVGDIGLAVIDRGRPGFRVVMQPLAPAGDKPPAGLFQ